ncbi:MAG: hypothetical protein QOH70_2054 [Blastocatellia bacterium]|jgi:hypothetical protein|nr:hypothetical protein [Blastocatellia bacterium]
MGKASLIKRILQRRDFAVSFWATFLAILALPSAVFTIVGMHVSAISTGWMVLFALSFSLILNRHLWRKRHLPIKDIFPNAVGSGRAILRCPCDLKLADEAKRLAQYWYPTETISPERFEQLRVKNPNILACLVGDRGDLLGYFDVIPLKESFAQQFLRGTITESQITHEDILGPDDLAQCKYVFLSGLAVWNPESYVDRRNANILVWGLLKYLDHFYGATERLAFASAATEEGEELLQRFDFYIGCEASARIDKRRMYETRLSRDDVTKRLAWLPDFSLLCSLDWAPLRIPVPRSQISSSHRRKNKNAAIDRNEHQNVI